ncbi:MAG: glycoside hydrolase family 3 C-terminal domain-containing protein, partial [Oscillospiraceae bacterium]|nr:glycoside hydrolase family 3 C-terminal domain-containing protein [Oscillospiraceae bacterium]
AVMAAYNEINHVPAVLNPELKTVLKDKWGLGFVITDGGDFSQNVTSHHAFASHAQSLAACLHAGTDIMLDDEGCVTAAARKALADGLITEEDLDTAVGNMLESRFLLGLFDAETPYDHLTRADVNTEADRALNRRAAREGIVLLDNPAGTLPLESAVQNRIGLFGQNADRCLKDWYTGYSDYLCTIRNGLEECGCDVVYDCGWDIVKLKAPNGKFVCIGEDDFLYADTDEEHAAEFYLCELDDDGAWTNLCHVQTGRFVNGCGMFPKLSGTEVYDWMTGESLRLAWSERLQGCIFSDRLCGKVFSVGEGGLVMTKYLAHPDRSCVFHMISVSDGWERMTALAKTCHAVLYCGGSDPMQVARECFDRRSIALPAVQREHLQKLSESLAETGIPLIHVLVSSYPYAMEEQIQQADATLWTCHAGPELGHAVADVIFGAYNPAGRLPQTWYPDDECLPPIGNYDIMQTEMTCRWYRGEVLFPFGYGLSYSRFDYVLQYIKFIPEGIHITVKVTNTSLRDGEEVVQVYARALSDRVKRPVVQLVGFTRLEVPAGQMRKAKLTIPLSELEIWDVTRERFCLETGDYEILIGASSRDIRCRQTLHIEGEEIPPRDLHQTVKAEFWDEQYRTELHTDPQTGKVQVRGLEGWHSQISFRNCCTDDITQITLRGAAPNCETEVQMYLDNENTPAAKIVLPVCDGFSDIQEVTAPFMPPRGVHCLRLVFPQYTCIESFRCQ